MLKRRLGLASEYQSSMSSFDLVLLSQHLLGVSSEGQLKRLIEMRTEPFERVLWMHRVPPMLTVRIIGATRAGLGSLGFGLKVNPPDPSQSPPIAGNSKLHQIALASAQDFPPERCEN